MKKLFFMIALAAISFGSVFASPSTHGNKTNPMKTDTTMKKKVKTDTSKTKMKKDTTKM